MPWARRWIFCLASSPSVEAHKFHCIYMWIGRICIRKRDACSRSVLYVLLCLNLPRQALVERIQEIKMDQLISAEEAAKHLNISKSTLAKMRLSGASPRYVKIGRRVAYRPSDLERWIASQSFNSTAEYSGRGPA